MPDLLQKFMDCTFAHKQWMGHQLSQMPSSPTKLAAGCVVYRHDPAGTPLLLLIYDKYGRWTIPKGHLEADETDQEAALREVLEETGVAGELGALVARIVYPVRSKRGLERTKQVSFFLLRADSFDTHPQAEEGISAAEWFMPDVALARIDYPQVRDVLARALAMLS
jgi:8-oxo-dGTP pyrophosphatase MutT (NUDIX family)